jgi:rubrerythrin
LGKFLGGFMANLKGSKTEANLKAAFAGESQARGKYIYFAAKAREQGHIRIAQIFEETALNEQEHARLWFKNLGGIGDTTDNLKTAIAGENYEWTDMYAEFGRVAKEEGFSDIAKQFEQVGAIEGTHEERYKKLLASLQASPGADAGIPVWKCNSCGHIVTAEKAPSTCPVCSNTDILYGGYRAFSQVKPENY